MAEPDDLVGIVSVHFEVEDIDISKAFKQDALHFHERFAGAGADIAQPQNRGAIADHGDQISAGGVLEGVVWIFFDLDAGDGDSRGVGKA
jgi:hypothetical protein